MLEIMLLDLPPGTVETDVTITARQRFKIRNEPETLKPPWDSVLATTTSNSGLAKYQTGNELISACMICGGPPETIWALHWNS